MPGSPYCPGWQGWSCLVVLVTLRAVPRLHGVIDSADSQLVDVFAKTNFQKQTLPGALALRLVQPQSQRRKHRARRQIRVKNRVLKKVAPTRPANLREMLHVKNAILAGELFYLLPPQPGMLRIEHHVWVERPLPRAITDVANQPRAFVLFDPAVDVLGDVFPNVFRDALGG